MTVDTTIGYQRTSGDGLVTVFGVDFALIEAAQLKVELVNKTTGVATLQTIATHYTLAIAEDFQSATVTMLIAPPATHWIVRRRSPTYVQPTHILPHGRFPADHVELALDRLAMDLQAVRDMVERSYRLNDSDAAIGTLVAPPALRANKLAAFNASGDPAISTLTVAEIEALAQVALGTSPAIVNTLADFKAFTTTPEAFLIKGSAAAYDGWGGLFVKVAGSVTAADDALVIRRTAGGDSYKRVYDPSLFYAAWWGVAPATAAATNLTQLQAAMATIEGLGGRELRITGECQISAAWVVTASGVTISGANPYRDKLVLTSTTADGIVVGTDVAAPREVFIKDLGFDATVVKVAGASVRFRYCANSGLENFVIDAPFKGVEVNAGYQINLHRGRIEMIAVNGAGLYFEGNRDGLGGGVRGSDVYSSDITMSSDSGAEPRANVWVVDFSGLWFENVGGVNGGTGLLIAPNAGDICEHIFSSECAWGDSGDGHGALLQPDGGTIRRWASNNDWFASSVGSGLTTAGTGTIDGLQLLNPRFLNNGTHGADFSKGTLTALSNIYLLNPVVTGNSQVAPGVSSGLKFVGVDKLSVIGGRSGVTSGFADTHKYNIELGAGNTNYLFDGVNVDGGVTGPILTPDAPSATKVIWNCIGYSGAFGPYAPIASPTFTGIVTAPVLNLSRDRAGGGPLNFVDLGAGGKTYQVGQGAGNMAATWNVWNTTDSIMMMQLTPAGAVTFASSVSGGAGTFSGTLSGVGLYLAGIAFADTSGNNRVLYDSDVNIVAYLGNAASPANYFDNTTTYLRSRGGGATFATINASAAAFQVPLTGPSFNGNTISAGTGTLTLGTATLNAGAGGTLGSNAFTSTAYAPLASPTFTGTVTSYSAANSLQISSVIHNENAAGPTAALGFNVSAPYAGETSASKGGIGFTRAAAQGGGYGSLYNRAATDTLSFTTANEIARWTSTGFDVFGTLTASSTFTAPNGIIGSTAGVNFRYGIDGNGLYFTHYDAGVAAITPLELRKTTGAVVANYALSAGTSISAGTTVNAAAASGYLLGGVVALRQSTNYTVLSTSNGVDAVFAGNASDPTNFYQNTQHLFRSASGATLFATLNSTGFLMPAGTGIFNASNSSGINFAGGTAWNSGATMIAYAAASGSMFEFMRDGTTTMTLNGTGLSLIGSMTSVGVTSTNTVTISKDPTSAVAISGAQSKVTIANGSNAVLAAFSGLILVGNPDNGATAIYLCGNQTAWLVYTTSATWVAPTTTPGAGTCSVQFDGAASYRIYNNYGSSQDYRAVIIASRGAT